MRMPFWGKHDFLNFRSIDVFIRCSVSRKSANVGFISYIFQGIKDPGGEGDEGFEEAFDDAIIFPVDITTYAEMDWSGGSMLKDPKVDKNWLDITIGEAGNFIIVNIKGILERINPLLYQG